MVSEPDQAGKAGCTHLVDAIVDFCEAGRVVFDINIDLIEAKALQDGLWI